MTSEGKYQAPDGVVTFSPFESPEFWIILVCAVLALAVIILTGVLLAKSKNPSRNLKIYFIVILILVFGSIAIAFINYLTSFTS